MPAGLWKGCSAHQLGIDHTKLTVRAQGRDLRLTDVGGKVLPSLLG